MTLIPAADPDLLATLAAPSAAWRWPAYRRWLEGLGGTPPPRLAPLLAASYIEWRYWSVLADGFQGILGLALVNPQGRFAAVAEAGLLAILAGRPGPSADQGTPDPTGTAGDLCWMHLFPLACCTFDDPAGDGAEVLPGTLTAAHQGHRLDLRMAEAASATLHLEAGDALQVELHHQGLPGMAIAPAVGEDLRRLPGGHWIVHCPAPVATTSGLIRVGPGFDDLLEAARRDGAFAYGPSAGAPGIEYRWQDANGYAEHSYGIQPLPLHGWDFLFVPDAAAGQSVVLQTYRGSRQLRYVEVCWQQAGVARYHRFDADALQLRWDDAVYDPLLGVRRPLRRRLQAASGGVRLTLEARVQHRLPLLRPRRLAARHFFIDEEIGVADWCLRDRSGAILAEARDQPCGGELAHRRLRIPAMGRAPAGVR